MSELTAELERMLLRALTSEWKRLNVIHFKDRMTPPLFELTDAERVLGRWHEKSRTIEISRLFVVRESWGVVVEVLKHEMAHQFVHEELGEHDESAHGPVFRSVCVQMGIDAAASGMPREVGKEDRIVARIAKLLALAESPNEHEAAAAATMAQRLMLKHNLDKIGTEQAYTVRFLGKPTGRVQEQERTLGAILTRNFFVRGIWVPVHRVTEGKAGTVLEISGTEDNVSMAEYVHGFLLHTAEDLWEQHRKSQRVVGNRDRRTYLAGVMVGFAKKLREDATARAGEGLVWVADADLDAYQKRRHPYTRNIRHMGRVRTSAFHEGADAGRNIIVRKPVSEGPTGGPRLLPSKRS